MSTRHSKRHELEEKLTEVQELFADMIAENDRLGRMALDFEGENQKLRQVVASQASLVEENVRYKERIAFLESNLGEGTKAAKLTIDPETVFYHAGQSFTRTAKGEVETFLLAQTEAGEVNLLSILDGNRWTNHMVVQDARKISKLDFHKHFDSHDTKWVLVS